MKCIFVANFRFPTRFASKFQSLVSEREDEMKKKAVCVGIFALVIFVNFVTIAQSSQDDPAYLMIVELKTKQEQKIQKWERYSNIALALVISVGTISAVIALLQKFKFKGIRLSTGILGLVVAITVVIDSNIYPDHQTLKKKIIEARFILEDVEYELTRKVKSQDRAKWREGIRGKLKRISEIEIDLLAGTESIDINFVASAYAQPRELPSWVTDPPSDDYYLYFVGNGQDTSLEVVESMSFQDAEKAAVDYLAPQIQSVEGISNSRIDFELLSEFLINAAEVYRTHYYLKRSDDLYRYYTLVRLARSSLEIDLTFFAIEKNIKINDTRKLSEKLQSTTNPTKAYYDQRDMTYKELLEAARESLGPMDHERFLRAREIRKGGNPRKALALIEEIVGKHPTFFLGWYNSGLIHDALGDSAEADSSYRNAIELEPSQVTRHASIYNTYGYFFFKHNNYLEAKEWFEKALQVNPNHVLAKNNLRVVQDSLDTR